MDDSLILYNNPMLDNELIIIIIYWILNLILGFDVLKKKKSDIC